MKVEAFVTVLRTVKAVSTFSAALRKFVRGHVISK